MRIGRSYCKHVRLFASNVMFRTVYSSNSTVEGEVLHAAVGYLCEMLNIEDNISNVADMVPLSSWH